tara:strand:+ start:1310 stop:3463 length:2154 start_codon:yes stop_codon:yes gene_type:complete
MHIQKFKQFQRLINESEETKNASNTGMYFEYKDEADKSIAIDYANTIEEQSGSQEAKAELDKILSGADLSAWNESWEIRKELDAGELKKEGGWYFGKGAWRINSSKAVALGSTPSWLTYYDPLHDEILENFFPELKGGAVANTQDSDSMNDIDSELDNITLPDFVPATADQEELAPVGESYKFKHIKSIYEAQEFTTGVPQNVEADAKVVTADDLEYMLMRNYNMADRFNVMIWGAPGIGKTQIVKNVAKKLEKERGTPIPVVIVALSNMMPTDLMGVPLLYDISDEGEGTNKVVLPGRLEGKIRQGTSVPAFLPSESESMEGILFFDEFNRADLDMLSASLTLLLDREALGGKYHIPNGWRVWAAGNRGMDGAVSELEPAVASRFLGGHVHLVPSIDGWIKWTRSESGLYKMVNGGYLEIDGSPQYYVPDEFHSYLLHAESEAAEKTSTGKKTDVQKADIFMDRKGKPIKTDFNRFYRFDAKNMTGEEGQSVGMATPRNWAAAWKIIFDTTLRQPKFQSQVTDEMTGGDPKRKGIAAMQLVMEDPEAVEDMEFDLTGSVGAKNAIDFVNYMKLLSRHSDRNGTIGEKVLNIFADPSKPRPLIGVAGVQPAEKFAVLSLILTAISNKGANMTEKELLNWAIWTIDVDADGKMDGGEMGAHVKQVVNPSSSHRTRLMGKLLKNSQDFRKTGKTNDKNAALKMQKWVSLYQEIVSGFTI